MPPRCFLGCPSDLAGHLHVFPNPKLFPEQFKKWVEIVGGQLNTPNDYDFFRSRRLCDRHFTEKDRVRNNRLSALAVPTLFPRVESCSELQPEIDVPLLQATFLLEHKSTLQDATALNSETNMAMEVPLLESTSSIGVSTGCSISALMDHNYCAPLNSTKFKNIELRSKRPDFSLMKYRREERRIKCLKQQIFSLRKRCSSFKDRLAHAVKMDADSAFQKVTKSMTSAAKIFTRMQSKQTHKRPSGRRFSLEEKILSLSLFKRSPKAYAFLSHCFTLPSKKTLKGMLAEIKIEHGINEKIFEKLKKTVKDMNMEDRLCTIIFDEMYLTPNINYDMVNDNLKGFVSTGDYKIADHVIVFMIKGVKANFKQPVAYYFTNALKKHELKSLIKEVISKVLATGLIILCSVCDQSSVNVGAISELVEETKSKVLAQGDEWLHDYYEVSNRKIIPLYDVPHMLKDLRNNLLTKDLMYVDADDEDKEKIVKWKYFQDIYAADKAFGELRLLNKLTEEHINPQKIKKMRVKTAAQIFSHSVAVVAEHLTARGVLHQDCRDLIPLVSTIDKLFDSLNSNTLHIPNGKIFKGCVRKTSPHHRFWVKAKKLMKSIKFISTKKTSDKVRVLVTTIPTTCNFIKTIEGFEVLWNILCKTYYFDCMMTRHFNQDPVEIFFGNIRSYGARNNSPNVIAFEGAFKALLLNNFNSPHSLSSNCENDDNKCLETLDFYIKEKSVNLADIPEENIEIPEELLMDNRVENDMGQRNYVCGWVITKCLKNIVKGCVSCKKNLIDCNTNKDNEYIKTKEYNKAKKWLTYPSGEAVNYFFEIQINTTTLLKKNVPKTNLRSKIICITNTLTNSPFNCEVHKDQLTNYFLKTSINILINSWCRNVNRILCGKMSYEGEDEIKVAAKTYYNKHKHSKFNK